MTPAPDCRFRNPDETADACLRMWAPLKPHFSPGRGRVSLGRTAAHFPTVAAELEGFARPLFGLAPLCAGGRDFDGRSILLEGITNGSDPDHSDFWGWPGARDQRIVESAALAFAVALAPAAFCDPLSQTAKDNLATWLLHVQRQEVPRNNWNFFHVLGSLALTRMGVDHDPAIRQRALDRIDSYYHADGWYSDGKTRHFDHYIGFAMHFYGLVYARLQQDLGLGDGARAERFRQRAALFADAFRHWTDDGGASLPFGRSMTYRFAQSSFWAALAYADVEGPAPGMSRALWASNMRWWARRDWCDRDGVMPVGYGYPNLNMSESYNSPGSPYWAMKAFLPLALAEDHPFWKEPETQPERPAKSVHPVPGMMMLAEPGNTVALNSIQECRSPHRATAEKYSKFAYSTSYGFSVDADAGGFRTCPFDNMIAFSADGDRFWTRSGTNDARISPEGLWMAWSPCPGTEVETWLLPRGRWHLRVHRIVTDRDLMTAEGGFAIPRNDIPPGTMTAGPGFARVRKDGHAGEARDIALSGAVRRDGCVLQALPNTSLYFPQTHVPQLRGQIVAGETWYAAAFLGSPNGPADSPEGTELIELESLRNAARPVRGLRWMVR